MSPYTVSHFTTYYLKTVYIFSAQSFSLKTTLPCSNIPNSVRPFSTVGLLLGTRNWNLYECNGD